MRNKFGFLQIGSHVIYKNKKHEAFSINMEIIFIEGNLMKGVQSYSLYFKPPLFIYLLVITIDTKKFQIKVVGVSKFL